MTKRKHNSKEFWQKHVEDWKKSGKSMSDYCYPFDINPARLSHHKVKLYGADKKYQNALKNKCKKNGFIPLNLNGSSSITITVKGISLSVPVSQLKEVIDVLGTENE